MPRSVKLVGSSNSGIKEWHRQIYTALLGTNAVFIVLYVIFNNYLGVILSAFVFFQGIWARIDDRASSYILNAIIQLMSAVIVFVALEVRSGGLERFTGSVEKENICKMQILIGLIFSIFSFMMSILDVMHKKRIKRLLVEKLKSENMSVEGLLGDNKTENIEEKLEKLEVKIEKPEQLENESEVKIVDKYEFEDEEPKFVHADKIEPKLSHEDKTEPIIVVDDKIEPTFALEDKSEVQNNKVVDANDIEIISQNNHKIEENENLKNNKLLDEISTIFSRRESNNEHGDVTGERWNELNESTLSVDGIKLPKKE